MIGWRGITRKDILFILKSTIIFSHWDFVTVLVLGPRPGDGSWPGFERRLVIYAEIVFIGILHPIDLMADGEVNWSDVSDLIEFYSSRRYEIEIQDQPLTLSTFFHDKKLKVSLSVIFQVLFQSQKTQESNLHAIISVSWCRTYIGQFAVNHIPI